MAMINGVNVGYTQNGNPYKKSNTGKNVGAAVGLATYAAAELTPYSVYNKVLAKSLKKVPNSEFITEVFKQVTKGYKNPLQFAKAFIKGDLTKEMIPMANEMKSFGIPGKLASKFITSKAWRAGYIGLGLAAGAAIFMGIGKLIGSGVDKIINKGAKAEADRNAELMRAEA